MFVYIHTLCIFKIKQNQIFTPNLHTWCIINDKVEDAALHLPLFAKFFNCLSSGFLFPYPYSSILKKDTRNNQKIIHLEL